MAMSHITLQYYYEPNFFLMQYHKYSMTEIENWIPWERELYINLLIQYIEKKKAEKEELSG